MKREITLGEAIATLLVVVMSMIGWGVSVEVRLATHKAEISTLIEMKQKIEEIHEKVITHDIKLDPATRDYFQTRGGEYKRDGKK